jgi:hypothetical protein
MEARLSGSYLYVTVKKKDGGKFSSSGKMKLKVGSPQTYGADRLTKSIYAGASSLSLNHNLASYSGYPKDFYVRYEGNDGIGWAWVGPIQVQFTPPVPGTPMTPGATATGRHAVSISWNSVQYAEKYALFRATSAHGSYKQIYCASTRNYTDSGSHLNDDTNYYYKLKAGNDQADCGSLGTGTGWSGFSSYKRVRTQSYPDPNVAGLSSDQSLSSGNSYTLRGTVYAGRGDTLTKVTAAVTGPGISGSNTSAMTSGNISSSYYHLNRFTFRTSTFRRLGTYTIGIWADTQAHNAQLIKRFNITVSEPVPGTPSRPSASVLGPISVQLSWGSVSYADKYALFRATSANGPYQQIYCANNLSRTDSGSHLSANTDYYYNLKAGNSVASCDSLGAGAGWSGYSDYHQVKTAPLPPKVDGLSNQILNLGGSYQLQGVIQAGFGDHLNVVTAAVNGPGFEQGNNSAMTNSGINSRVYLLKNFTFRTSVFKTPGIYTVGIWAETQAYSNPIAPVDSFTITVVDNDTEAPVASLSGIDIQYVIGDVIRYSAQATDNKQLSLMRLHVADAGGIRVVDQSWPVSGTSAAQSGSIDTADWQPGTYRYTLFVKDGQDNVNEVQGQFELRSGLGTPVISAPAADAVVSGDQQNFAWQAVLGANVYRVVVSETADFAGFVENADDGSQSSCLDGCFTQVVQTNAFAGFSLNPGSTYYWKVRAGNTQTGQGGDWSDVASFMVADDKYVNVSFWAQAAADFLVQQDIVKDPANHDLRGTSQANRVELAVMLFRALGGGAAHADARFAAWAGRLPTAAFQDVTDASTWFYQAVTYLAYLQFDDAVTVFNRGRDAAPLFNPAQPISRGWVLKALLESWNIQPLVIFDDLTAFDDVPFSHPAAGYIYRAVQLGLVQGDAQTHIFRPDAAASREDIFVMLHRLMVAKANLLGTVINQPPIAASDFAINATSGGRIGIRYEQPVCFGVSAPVFSIQKTQAGVESVAGTDVFVADLTLNLSSQGDSTCVDSRQVTHQRTLFAAWRADAGVFVDTTPEGGIPFSSVRWFAPDRYASGINDDRYRITAYLGNNLGHEISASLALQPSDAAVSSVRPDVSFDALPDQVKGYQSLTLAGSASDAGDTSRADTGIREVMLEYSDDGSSWLPLARNIAVDQDRRWQYTMSVPDRYGALFLRAKSRNIAGNLSQDASVLTTQVIPTYRISGFVLADGGGALVNAKVLLRAGSSASQTYSDNYGSFLFNGLSAGDYTVYAEHDGQQSLVAQVRLSSSDARGTVSLVMHSDADNDSLDQENHVPSLGNGQGDGNGDGTADTQQGEVSSFESVTGAGWLTYTNDVGAAQSGFVNAAMPLTVPFDQQLVHGMTRFDLDTASGAAVLITLYVTRNESIRDYLLLGRDGRWYAQEATITHLENKTRIVFRVVEGGNFDRDGTTNGTLQLVDGGAMVATGVNIWPSVFRFGQAELHTETSVKRFTVFNPGSRPLTIQQIDVAGAHPDLFRLKTDHCSGQTVAPNDRCHLTVAFQPDSVGSKSALLQVHSDDPDNPRMAVFLNNYEALQEEASRRLPPVLASFNIKNDQGETVSTMYANSEYTIEWSLLGYHQSYLTSVAMFNCTGIPDNTRCGANYSDDNRFLASGSASLLATPTAGKWQYKTTRSRIHRYSYTFTTPDFTQETPIVIRFYRLNKRDQRAGKGGLSLIIPGNHAAEYYDTTGRRIKNWIYPVGSDNATE